MEISSSLTPISCFKHFGHVFFGCLSLLCGASHALLPHSLKLAGSRSATPYLATARLSARGLHPCIWRLSCGLLEVGLQYVLDLAASHRLGHLYLSWHVWSRCSFVRNLDLFLKLFDITSTRSFHDVRISSGTFSLVELEMRMSRFFLLTSHAPCATQRQCL